MDKKIALIIFSLGSTIVFFYICGALTSGYFDTNRELIIFLFILEPVLILIAILIGISTLSFHGVIITHIGEQAEAGQVGTTIGVAAMMSSLGKMVITPLFGYLVDISGSYSLAWRAAAAVAFVSTLVLLGFSRERQQQ